MTPDFLRDPFWQFVGAVLSIGGIVDTVAVARVYGRKKLTYRVVSYRPLLSPGKEVSGKVKIYYEDQLVHGVHLVLIHVRNSGRIPIEVGDYDKRLGFVFDEGAQILSAEIVGTKPADVETTVIVEQRKVLLCPALLNPGWGLALQILLSKPGRSEGIQAEGRIVGVSEIKEDAPQRIYERYGWVFLIAMLFPNLIIIASGSSEGVGFPYLSIIGIVVAAYFLILLFRSGRIKL